VFEPRVGGGIVDRAEDGSECRWARILAFEPPGRVVFSWDISPRWTIETDEAQTSEVEARFYAESPTRTRAWLFPGGRPGQPIGDDRLGMRQAVLGSQQASDRSGGIAHHPSATVATPEARTTRGQETVLGWLHCSPSAAPRGLTFIGLTTGS
jgi:hypothetical protein